MNYSPLEKMLQWMKRWKRTDWIALLLIGVLVAVVLAPGSSAPVVGTSQKKATGAKLLTGQTTDSAELDLEQRLEHILEQMQGVGQVQVMVTKHRSGTETGWFAENRDPAVEGVVVVAQGADDAMVRQRIMDAVMALFDVEIHKITIVKMSAMEGEN